MLYIVGSMQSFAKYLRLFDWQNKQLTRKTTHSEHNNVNEHTEFWLTCCVSKNQNQTKLHNYYSAEKAIGERKRNFASFIANEWWSSNT